MTYKAKSLILTF